jgi:hypothetical protein
MCHVHCAGGWCGCGVYVGDITMHSHMGSCHMGIRMVTWVGPVAAC